MLLVNRSLVRKIETLRGKLVLPGYDISCLSPGDRTRAFWQLSQALNHSVQQTGELLVLPVSLRPSLWFSGIAPYGNIIYKLSQLLRVQ